MEFGDQPIWRNEIPSTAFIAFPQCIIVERCATQAEMVLFLQKKKKNKQKREEKIEREKKCLIEMA